MKLKLSNYDPIIVNVVKTLFILIKEKKCYYKYVFNNVNVNLPLIVRVFYYNPWLEYSLIFQYLNSLIQKCLHSAQTVPEL